MSSATGNNPQASSDGRHVRTVRATRISADDGTCKQQAEQVAVEQAVTITIDRVGSFTILCTPREVDALAVGFAFTEGMIDGIDDIVARTDFNAATGAIAMEISDPSRVTGGRNLIVASSCGLCGSRNIEKLLSDETACGDSMRLHATVLNGVTETMRAGQELFAATGAAHAAGVFDASGRIVALAEDIGRHNAMDKAIGKCLLARQDVIGRAVVLSGRVTLELVAKAVAAGLEVIVAVSAPSSLAVEVAEKCNITLCAFVRPGRATVYTHPRRITGIGK